jgi:ABC-type Mn2+/Zn2+ transport system permease subunit
MEVIDLVLDPLRSGIDRRALLDVVLVGAPCGALSFWVVAYRLEYPAESLSHGLLPGLVVAALLAVPLLLGAGAGVAVAAGLVALASRDERIGADTATAIVVTGTFALGSLLALSPNAPARLSDLLFGDPLGVADSDLLAAGVLALAGAVALAALHRPLCAVAFDAAGAAALGVAPARVRLALLGLIAAAVAVAVQGLGSLLALAVMVAPAVAVRRHSASPAQAVVAASALAALAGIAGILFSHHVGGAAGACVALALCLAAAVGSVLPPLRRGARGPAGPAAG